MMVLFPNRSKVGDNMFYLFFSRTLLSCCLSYCSQTTNFQNRRRCSVSAVTFHCSWTCSQAQKRRGPGKSSFSGLANISCMHWTFTSSSFVGGKWKILWNLMEFLLFSCLQTTPSSSPPWETQILTWGTSGEAMPSIILGFTLLEKHSGSHHSAWAWLFHQTLHPTLILLLLLLFIILSSTFRIRNRQT